MAEQKVDENVNRVFEDVRFEKVEDGYTVKVDYDAHSESLSLQFVNETTKSIFKERFDKDKLNEINMNANVAPAAIVKMMTDALDSGDAIIEKLRLYLVKNSKEGMYCIYYISYIL